MNKATRNLVGLIIIVIVILGFGYFFMNRNGSNVFNGVVKDSGSNISDYSAVFLTNGQVYFGKISAKSATEVNITDIYYLQVNQQQNLQQGTDKTAASPSASPDISLVKLGNELHGPNDRMHINSSQVLFTESLKSDSKVVKAIADYKAK